MLTSQRVHTETVIDRCPFDKSHKSQHLGLATAAHVQLSVIRVTQEWSLWDGMVGQACNCCGQQAEITRGVGRDKYTHSQHYGRSSMAVAQVWHYRGMRGEMTGTALTGRLGIIPTLGHIINSYISE